MKKEFETKKLILSLLVLTILISVFGTLAVLDATKGLKTTEKKLEPAIAEEPVKLSTAAATVSFAILERPEE